MAVIEYICLNPKCRQIQDLDEIHDGESDEFRCSYCYGDAFFEREVSEVEFDQLDREFKLIDIAERNLKRLTELDS